MSTDHLTLSAVEGALPPAAIMCLGHRLAAVAGANPETGPFAPDRISFGDGGLVHMTPGPVSPRWRAPEVRSSASHTTTSELWGLGRLLLELSLGRPVDDATADHADENTLRGLFDVDGNRLPDRVVEILAVLLNPKADERLQSARAAERVFKDAESRFGDGSAALGAALANAARRRQEHDDGIDRSGVGDPDDRPAVTMQLSTRDILDTGKLKKAAVDAEIERRRQQSVPVKRTEELPARAILSAEELDRVANAAKKKEQALLPTQIVRKRETGSAPIDGEIIPQPKLLGPSSDAASSSSSSPAPLLALPAPSSEPSSSEPSSSEPSLSSSASSSASSALQTSSEPSSLASSSLASSSAPSSSASSSSASSDEDAPERALAQAEKQRRGLLIAAAIALVVLVVVVVAAVSQSTPELEPLPDGAVPVDNATR